MTSSKITPLVGLIAIVGEEIMHAPYRDYSMDQPTQHPAERNIKKDYGREEWHRVKITQPYIVRKKYHLRI